MFEKHTSDLHCHLNGSFSLGFLKKVALKNNCISIYEELALVKEAYLKQTGQQPEFGYSGELLGLVWKQFGLIHKIIQDLTDIRDGTVDVVENSNAKYLEIRTTPKVVAGGSRDHYIDTFESGLLYVRDNKAFEKRAVGLLSLDRTIHTLDDAVSFIERIVKSPKRVLVGLDISGNPSIKRTLTGDGLGQVVLLALKSNVGIAIHMGESDTEIERRDTDAVLNALDEWMRVQPAHDKNPLYGKVRLGHCIYLTEEQRVRIRKLGIPIEVCPTCHSKLNWHLEKDPHPVVAVYTDLSEPLVGGTDDVGIFGASAKDEFSKLFQFFSNKKSLDKTSLKEHQSQFRFEPPEFR